MRIVFVEPRGSDDNVFAKYLSLPLMGPIYLATLLKQKGHQAQCFNENLLGRSISDEELSSDILCITSLTLSIQRAYHLASRYRSLNPNGKVIIGGIHASMLPEEAAQYADYVFVGEGELQIVDIVEKIASNQQKTQIIRADGLIDMDAVPTPDFSLLKNSHKMYMAPAITSRGCPFDCNFCSVTQMFGKKYRMRSIPKVIQDIRAIKQKKIFFYDDNFSAIKSRTRDLLKAMKRNHINKKWTTQVRSDAAKDPKLIEQMADAGCYTVYVGFESVNPETLKELQKGQTPKEIRNAIRTFHDNSIEVHGMFMFGADADDKHTPKRTLNFCHDNDLDFAQFAILTPLPGTGTFHQMEKAGRLLHKDWRYYEGLHVVFKPKLLTPYQLQQGMIEAFHDFYSYSRAINDSLNAVADLSTVGIRALYEKVQIPNFSAIAVRTAAKSLVSKWERQNQEYLDFLHKISIKTRLPKPQY
ncbi:B12-binding domain-containing radical SAM protein [Nanoarchaeota archaeon]